MNSNDEFNVGDRVSRKQWEDFDMKGEIVEKYHSSKPSTGKPIILYAVKWDTYPNIARGYMGIDFTLVPTTSGVAVNVKP